MSNILTKWLADRNSYGEISVVHDGFNVSSHRPVEHVRWNEVELIAAFKFDEFTYDTICLKFELIGAKSVTVNEDLAGYTELVKLLPEKFPTFEKDFFPKIAQPAFAENYTVVYERQDEG